MLDALMTTVSSRARPLSVEDRRAAIIDSTIPLLLERGKDVTSREIAEAAGVAEGTIFRAFGDKDSLILAAVDRYLDPLALRAALRGIDGDLSLERKLSRIFDLLRDRFAGIIRMMSAVERHGPPPKRDDDRMDFAETIAELLEPHRDELRIEPAQVAQFARMISFAAAIPVFGESLPFGNDDIIDFFSHGVMRADTAADVTTTTKGA